MRASCRGWSSFKPGCVYYYREADILLEETVSIVSPNHRVRKIDIFDDGLKHSLVVLGDLATEDGGNLVGLTDLHSAAYIDEKIIKKTVNSFIDRVILPTQIN